MEVHHLANNPLTDQESIARNLNCMIDDCVQRVVTHQEPSGHSLAVMSAFELADRSISEIKCYRRGEPCDDQYGVELFRRALKQRDPVAWEMIQKFFNEMMLHWLHSHPLRKIAYDYESEENYVAQAFSRFWQATVFNQEIEFRTMGAVLQYLRASLNGTVFDTLRTYSRTREISLLDFDDSGEQFAEDREDSLELWEIIQALIPEKRQRRVAYLILHCHLKPRQIILYCSQEFSDVEEIYRLRRNVVERLLRNADYIRRRLDIQ